MLLVVLDPRGPLSLPSGESCSVGSWLFSANLNHIFCEETVSSPVGGKGEKQGGERAYVWGTIMLIKTVTSRRHLKKLNNSPRRGYSI